MKCYGRLVWRVLRQRAAGVDSVIACVGSGVARRMDRRPCRPDWNYPPGTQTLREIIRLASAATPCAFS